MRREQGLAATCALWGAIQDAGFLARNTETLDALQNRMGGKALQATEALDALEGLMLSGRSGEGVLDYEWRALKRFLPSANSPKFSEIAALSPDAADGGGQSSEIQALLDTMSDEELLPIFMDMLRTEVAEILRISPDKLEADTSLYDIGLDSLMGVELMLAIENRFGQSLPTMSLADNHTLSKLAALLLKQMRQSGGIGNAGGTGGDGTSGEIESPAQDAALQSQAHHLARQHAADITTEQIEEILSTIEPASKGEQR
ncbi:acyl carrier protein [Orrella marina]